MSSDRRRARRIKPDRRDLNLRAARPELSFFCELSGDAITRLFADGRVAAWMKELKATVTIGLVDLGPERAAVVRDLNARGVPVAAWLLLPQECGYWCNSTNAPQAAARYDAFRAWTAAEGLRWTRVGLDIEPNLQDVQAVRHSPLALVYHAAPRLFDEVDDARDAYQALIERIQGDGWPVDAYVFPFIHTEREAGTSSLQRVTGMLDLEVDREICMLYTSFARPHGPALLDLYGPHFPALAVGVTGGGVEEGVDPPEPLSWEEFARDLRLARRHTRDIHVFSLEGCVERGWMERLLAFDWRPGVRISAESARHASTLVRRIDLGLRLLEYPYLAAAAVAAATAAAAALPAGFLAWALNRQSPATVPPESASTSSEK